jgi:hypothetical protein
MRNKVLIFLCFLLFSNCCLVNAQRTKDLTGKVTANGEDVTGVVVKNITTENATITNDEGLFEIPVHLNDTLIFLAVQYKNKVLPVASEIFNTDFVTVPLVDFVNELDEVVVSPYNLSGAIDKDIQNLTLEKDVSAEALGLPNSNVKIITQSERKLQEASKGMYSLKAPLAVNINPIINAITGRTKMLKKRVAVDKKYTQTQAAQASFEVIFFTQTLKIPEGNIDDFMYYCEVDTAFQKTIETGDQLKLWEFLRVKSLEYRKNNSLSEK